MDATQLTQDWDPEELAKLVQYLRDLGVSEFSYGALNVKFIQGIAAMRPIVKTIGRQEDDDEEEKGAKVVVPKDIYHDPRLWGGQAPPGFPKTDED